MTSSDLMARARALPLMARARALLTPTHRPLSAVEVAACVDFPAIVAAQAVAVARITVILEPLWDQTRTVLAGLLTGLPAPVALARLADLASPGAISTLPEVGGQQAAAATAIRAILAGVGKAGWDLLNAELAAQHVPSIGPAPAAPSQLRTALDTVGAGQLASLPEARILTAALTAATPAARAGSAIPAAVWTATADLSRAGVTDLAGQLVHVAHGSGRAAGIAAHLTRPVVRLAGEAPPTAPALVYASELLDRNTCLPCSHTDGRDYTSLEDAMLDYPDGGGYIDCLGGERCRGTLVLIGDDEVAATLQAHRPAEPRPDRTPPAPARQVNPLRNVSDADLQTRIEAADAEGSDDIVATIEQEMRRREAARNRTVSQRIGNLTDAQLDQLAMRVVANDPDGSRITALADYLDDRAGGVVQLKALDKDPILRAVLTDIAREQRSAATAAVRSEARARRIEWEATNDIRALQAEEATNGHMLSKSARGHDVESFRSAARLQRDLFDGKLNPATMRWAVSPELEQWFADHGWPEPRAVALGDPAARRRYLEQRGRMSKWG